MEQIGIVLVDNYPTFQGIARRFIQQDRTLRIVGSADHENALAVVARENPQVVILDLGMADTTAFETLARLHVQMPRIHIIALTLFDEECYRQAALKAGAEALIAKDYLYTELMPCIHRIVNE